MFGEEGLWLDLVGHAIGNYKSIISWASSHLFKWGSYNLRLSEKCGRAYRGE